MAKVSNKSAPHHAHKVIRTTFDGLPIVDAEANFSIIVRNTAVKAAKGNEKDATNCILAKACAKQVGASKVAFLRTVAYLELPDAKGNRRVVRYMMDEDAQAIVKAFDRGKTVKGEVMVTLKAPAPGRRLDRIRERWNARREAIIRGEITDTGYSSGTHTRRNSVKDLDVRDGRGLIHNILKKA